MTDDHSSDVIKILFSDIIGLCRDSSCYLSSRSVLVEEKNSITFRAVILEERDVDVEVTLCNTGDSCLVLLGDFFYYYRSFRGKLSESIYHILAA